MPNVKFADGPDIDLITKIVDRAIAMAAKHGTSIDRVSLHMDISAAHANGCPLRLNDLLKADDFNFAHDVFGISNHIDRRTGKLGLFLPRFARIPQEEAHDEVAMDISAAHASWLVLAEWKQGKEGEWVLKHVKSAKVDGKKIKENVFYTLKDGKFVEAGE